MLKLKDCELLNFDTRLYYCKGDYSMYGYGPQFVSKIIVETTNYIMNIEINNKRDYILSQYDCVKLLTHNLEKIQNMTENEFVVFLQNFFEDGRRKRIMETKLTVCLRLKKNREK